MPSTSERQRRFMGAELGRLRAGKKTRTGMKETQLEDFAMKMKPKSHMPKGVSQSPSGDIGAHRQMEADMQKGFKNAGKIVKTAGKFGSAGK